MKNHVKSFGAYLNEAKFYHAKAERVNESNDAADWFAPDNDSGNRYAIEGPVLKRWSSKWDADRDDAWGEPDEELSWDDFTDRYGERIPKPSPDSSLPKKVQIWKDRTKPGSGSRAAAKSISLEEMLPMMPDSSIKDSMKHLIGLLREERYRKNPRVKEMMEFVLKSYAAELDQRKGK